MLRFDRRLAVIWAAFFLRLAFYSAMLPLWEGYDEWSHFAVIRSVSNHGEPLVPRDAPVPRDVDASLRLAPVPWELRSLDPSFTTQDDFWRLPPAERAARQTAFAAIPSNWGREDATGALTAYEALQPPLYYWLMAPVLQLCSGLALGTQVILLRWLSSLIASLVIPLVYYIAREVFDRTTGLGCAAIVALMPGFALDVARVANDCLAVVLFTLLTWLILRMVTRGLDLRLSLCLGATLALGLLTKAYFLTVLPVLFFVGRPPRSARISEDPPLKERFLILPLSRLQTLACAFLLPLLLAAWWYLRNWRLTGTLSGLSESVTLQHHSLFSLLREAASLNWAKAVDAILFSHLYFGGWSSLTVRSWMYHVFYAVILAAALGLIWRLLQRAAHTREILALLAIYSGFWLGQLYNVLLLFVSKGLPGSMGWYMYAVVAAQVLLCVAGLRQLLPASRSVWPLRLGAVLLALLDVYSLHAIAVPYYTGMIRHKPNGALSALHSVDWHSVGWPEALDRLTMNKDGLFSPALIAFLWALYCFATICLVLAAGRAPATSPDPSKSPPSR